MKTYIYSVLAATMAGALCLPLGSCSESAELGDGKYTVSLNPHKLSISSNGSTQLRDADDGGYQLSEVDANGKTYSLKVDAENTAWHFTGIPNWIKFSPASGNKSENVEMMIEANPPQQGERIAKLTFESTDPEWEYSIPITIKQAEASPKITKKD